VNLAPTRILNSDSTPSRLSFRFPNWCIIKHVIRVFHK
jgi:hypothetical protein